MLLQILWHIFVWVASFTLTVTFRGRFRLAMCGNGSAHQTGLLQKVGSTGSNLPCIYNHFLICSFRPYVWTFPPYLWLSCPFLYLPCKANDTRHKTGKGYNNVWVIHIFLLIQLSVPISLWSHTNFTNSRPFLQLIGKTGITETINIEM